MALKKIWDHLEEFILLPILIFLVGLIFTQVIMRYCFGNSITWSEELARYLFVWLMWLGVSYAARNRTHLRITMIRDKLPPKGAYWMEFAVIIIWLCFGIFVVIKGISIVQSVAGYGQVSAALQLPMQYAYLGVSLGAGLMDIRLIEILVHNYIAPHFNHKKSESDNKGVNAQC